MPEKLFPYGALVSYAPAARDTAQQLIRAQGFQTVCTVASRNFNLLTDTDAENISLPLSWAADPAKSRFSFV